MPKINRYFTFIEAYKLFDIMKCECTATKTLFYQIFKGGVLFSAVVAGSPKGCKNIIDAHYKHNLG